MPITRSVWIDDDGSGTTGTVLNNSELQKIYNNIDAAIVGMVAPQSGVWTPIDVSGAALVFPTKNARYWRLDKLIVISAHVVYPAITSALSAKIGGIPALNGGVYGGLYPANSLNYAYYLAPASDVINISDPTGNPRTNTQMSGASIIFAGVYLTA